MHVDICKLPCCQSVSQSVSPVSLCKPPKLAVMELDIDLTPMHIPCIVGGISKPHIYKKIDYVVRCVCKKN